MINISAKNKWLLYYIITHKDISLYLNSLHNYENLINITSMLILIQNPLTPPVLRHTYI